MGFESSATYINQLVITNPDDTTDFISGGDDHLRLIKRVLQATFPYITGPLDVTQNDLTKAKYLNDVGSANAIIVSPTPAWSTYEAGKGFYVKVAVTNNGATTAKVNSLSPIAIIDNNGNALQAGTLTAGSVHQLIYDGTSFRLSSQNGYIRNEALVFNSSASENGAILNAKTGTLTLGTNGHANIVLNSDGSINLGSVALSTTLLTEWAAGNFPMPGDLSGATVTATTSLRLKNTGYKSAIITVDTGKLYVKRTSGIDGVTTELPATGYWGIDHDIDLGTTTFGNNIIIHGDVRSDSAAIVGTIKANNYKFFDTIYGESPHASLTYDINNSRFSLAKTSPSIATLDVDNKRVLTIPVAGHTNQGSYVPKYMGYLTALSSPTPTQYFSANMGGQHTTPVRIGTGNYTITFPGIGTINGFNFEIVDSNTSCVCRFTAVSGNQIAFKVFSTAGTPIDPNVAIYITVFGQ